MSCCNNSFQKIEHLGVPHSIDVLEQNLKLFYEWNFLRIGGFKNITKGQPGPEGGDLSEMRPLEVSPGYAYGSAWQGVRTKWVYETSCSGASPLYTDLDGSGYDPSGVAVWVDNVLQPSSNYIVNYELGMVAFVSGQPLTSNVQVQHTDRVVPVYLAAESPWWKEVQMNAWDVDSGFFQRQGCGAWVMNGSNRVQLPCLIIEPVPRMRDRARGLGECRKVRELDVAVHILAEEPCDVKSLTDVVLAQSQNCLDMFDLQCATERGLLPLDCNGQFTGVCYPELLSECPGECIRINETTLTGSSDLTCGIHYNQVRHVISYYFGV